MSATLVDEAAFGSTPTSATFTSAFRAAPHGRDPSASARRRRGSESITSTTAPAAGARALGHARSHTEDHTNGRHPLRSPTPGPSIPRGRVMPGDATRPRLQRVLSSDMDVTARADTWEHEEPRADKSVERSDGSSRARDEETVVLVHQVMPSDSLAGVALKHGVTLADLRRANKLWASDSIHLRKVLYVPLKASHIASLEPVPTPQTAPPDGSSPWVPASDGPSPPAADIRRVPTSHLSFFPPPAPARSALPDDSLAPFSSPPGRTTFAARSQTLPRRRPPSLSGTGTGFSPLASFFPATGAGAGANGTLGRTANGAGTISSLLSSLPMALPRPLAAAAARASFDSSRSSPSSTSEAADVGQAHEMGDVSHARQRRRARSRSPPRGPVDDFDVFAAFGVRPEAGDARTPRARRSVPSYTAPPPPPPGPELVRTTQMAPSPAMLVPAPPKPGADASTAKHRRVWQDGVVNGIR